MTLFSTKLHFFTSQFFSLNTSIGAYVVSRLVPIKAYSLALDLFSLALKALEAISPLSPGVIPNVTEEVIQKEITAKQLYMNQFKEKAKKYGNPKIIDITQNEESDEQMKSTKSSKAPIAPKKSMEKTSDPTLKVSSLSSSPCFLFFPLTSFSIFNSHFNSNFIFGAIYPFFEHLVFRSILSSENLEKPLPSASPQPSLSSISLPSLVSPLLPPSSPILQLRR